MSSRKLIFEASWDDTYSRYYDNGTAVQLNRTNDSRFSFEWCVLDGRVVWRNRESTIIKDTYWKPEARETQAAYERWLSSLMLAEA